MKAWKEIVMERKLKNVPIGLRNKINKATGAVSKGIFSDEYWKGHKQVYNALVKICDELSLEVELQKSEYRQDQYSKVPNSKIWIYRVYNDEMEGWFNITASGAGTVEDPLSKYDIVAYIS